MGTIKRACDQGIFPDDGTDYADQHSTPCCIGKYR